MFSNGLHWGCASESTWVLWGVNYGDSVQVSLMTVWGAASPWFLPLRITGSIFSGLYAATCSSLRWWLLLLCSLLEKHCSLSQCRCVSLLLNAFSACPFALKVNSFPLLRHQMTSVDPVLSLLLTLYLLQSPCPVNHLLLLSLCFFFLLSCLLLKWCFMSGILFSSCFSEYRIHSSCVLLNLAPKLKIKLNQNEKSRPFSIQLLFYLSFWWYVFRDLMGYLLCCPLRARYCSGMRYAKVICFFLRKNSINAPKHSAIQAIVSCWLVFTPVGSSPSKMPSVVQEVTAHFQELNDVLPLDLAEDFCSTDLWAFPMIKIWRR